MRTLWWYHRALDEEDPVNRFSLQWTALESLNPLLTEFWQLKPNRRSCPQCSADLGNLHGVYGIDKLLREIPETTENLFRRARDLRNAIVHGTKRPAAMRIEARALLVPIEAAIPRGIARLFSLAQGTEDSLARPVIPQRPYYSASVRIMFTRAGRGELGLPGFYPHVELSVKTHTRFDEHLEPQDFTFHGDVIMWCSETFLPEKISVTAHVRGGDQSIQLDNLLLRRSDPATEPPHRGHGVTLWQKPTGHIWTPHDRKPGSLNSAG